MEVRPPHLFGTEDGGARLLVTCDVAGGVIEATVRGRFGERLGRDVHLGLRKCLAEHPSALIVDLHGLDDPYASSATLWMAVNRAAGIMQPPVRLVLAVPPAAPLAGRLRRLGAARFLPVYPTVSEARTAVAGTAPLTDRLCLPGLPPEPLSASAARDLVGVACAAWQMSDLLMPARSIMSELADNAVEHAGTDLAAAVWRRGSGIHLSVHDGDPRLPRLLDAPPGAGGGAGDERGRGLRIVDARSTAWGAMTTRSGKMVWATLRR
jgi:hypothetical protein